MNKPTKNPTAGGAETAAPAPRKTRRPQIAPAVADVNAVADYCQVSPCEVRRWNSTGKMPKPFFLPSRGTGKAPRPRWLWSVIRPWVAAGMPARAEWEAKQGLE